MKRQGHSNDQHVHNAVEQTKTLDNSNTPKEQDQNTILTNTKTTMKTKA